MSRDASPGILQELSDAWADAIVAGVNVLELPSTRRCDELIRSLRCLAGFAAPTFKRSPQYSGLLHGTNLTQCLYRFGNKFYGPVGEKLEMPAILNLGIVPEREVRGPLGGLKLVEFRHREEIYEQTSHSG
jgi:hypothetical protein